MLTALSRPFRLILCLAIICTLSSSLAAQMRQIRVNATQPENHLNKFHFLSASEGYIAFERWIGYTADSGRTVTEYSIRFNNVDFNGYLPGLTLGFSIEGVHAYTSSIITVYGHYDFVPAILRSENGGQTFKLVYYGNINPNFDGGIKDLSHFHETYAVDIRGIMVSSDLGNSWNYINTSYPYLNRIQAVTANTVYAATTYEGPAVKMVKTSNAGNTWAPVTIPGGTDSRLWSFHFINANTGWIALEDAQGQYAIYMTTNGGDTWTLQTRNRYDIFSVSKFKFIDANTGYGISGFTTYKTTDGGRIWEPLPRDNNFSIEYRSLHDLATHGTSQVWAGGASGFIELSTNGGGTPLPKAYFEIDTVGSYVNNEIQLVNKSKAGYTYRWLLNGTEFSTSYHSSYIRNVDRLYDTISLIVSNGTYSDTLEQSIIFLPQVVITSFTPTEGRAGTVVTINGVAREEVASVSFGGVPAQIGIYPGPLMAVVSEEGATGDVLVTLHDGRSARKSGFTFYKKPTLTSMTPMRATAGMEVTITGTEFHRVEQLSLGGTPITNYQVISPELIKAIVPSGPSGNLVLQAFGGTDTIFGFIAEPVITSFTPTAGTEETILEITGTSLTDIQSVTIGGIPTKRFVVHSSTSIHAIVGTGASGAVVITKPDATASRPGFTWHKTPAITSFSPANGPLGTTVIITGSDFDAVAANNIVHVGSIPVSVSSATPTSLHITIPPGAINDKISVTTNNLTAISEKEFQVTFPNGGSITPSLFEAPVVIQHTMSGSGVSVATGDYDGDGRSDLIYFRRDINDGPQGYDIYRNTGSGAAVSFAPVLSVQMELTFIGQGDLDGDGKIDLVIKRGASLDFLRNTSTTGSISFTLVAGWANEPVDESVILRDLDKDGKADIIFQSGRIIRNTSNPGQIRFDHAGAVSLASGFIDKAFVTDIDNDNHPDILLGNFEDSMPIFKNLSTPGNLSFQRMAPLDVPRNLMRSREIIDLNMDGLRDILSPGLDEARFLHQRNISSGTSLVYEEPKATHTFVTFMSTLPVDLDGDGVPDMVTAERERELVVYKNLSTSTDIRFSQGISTAGSAPSFGANLYPADLNGDGKPDIVYLSQNILRVFVNKSGRAPFISSFSPGIGTAGTTVTITGINLSDVTAVSIGGVPATGFTIVSPTTITAVVGNGTDGPVKVENAYGFSEKGDFIFGVPPSITMIAPVRATGRSTITITGTGFSNVMAENLVSFGSVRAEVLTASATQLTVKAPTVHTNVHVSVSVGSRTAYSSELFTMLNTTPSADFSINSFTKETVPYAGIYDEAVDIDGDGKPDLVQSGIYNTPQIGILINNSTGTNVSFAAPQLFSIPFNGRSQSSGDFDGDGKPDLVIQSTSQNKYAVLRNISLPGSAAFGAPLVLDLGLNTNSSGSINIIDIDKDGRPDLAVIEYNTSRVSIYRNISSPGNIDFAARIEIPFESYGRQLAIGDIDYDGKPDIVAAGEAIEILRNTGQPGTISFTRVAMLQETGWPGKIVLADVDGNGKKDIVVADLETDRIFIYANSSTPGNIAFQPATALPASVVASNFSLGDLSGDGLPDMLLQVTTENFTSRYHVLLRNTSCGGTISFADGVPYYSDDNAYASALADVNGDGFIDMIIHGGQTHVFLNQVIPATTVVVCPRSSKSITTSRSGTTYQWQMNSGSGFQNLTNQTNISGVQTQSLQLSDIQTEWTGRRYRCVVDGTPDTEEFLLQVTGTVVYPYYSISATENDVCAGTSVTFTAMGQGGGVVPTYQWFVNNAPVGTNASSFTSSTLAHNDSVHLRVISSEVCASPGSFITQKLGMIIKPIQNASLTVTRDPGDRCEGLTVMFRANPAAGLTNMSYTWKINGSVAAHSTAPQMALGMFTGDILSVDMSISGQCVATSTASASLPPIVMVPYLQTTSTIQGNTTIQAGDYTLITTAHTGHDRFSYTWEDSTSAHDWQRINQSEDRHLYQPASTGDKIRCRIRVITPCADPQDYLTNTLRFELTEVPAGSGVIAPNPVTDRLNVQQISFQDKWETLEIVSLNGVVQHRQPIRDLSQTSINVSHLGAGVYTVVLKRSAGDYKYMRFIKL